jgi:6-pyruvoyltetrahydropterin/6-carboxytetrahydropterin synthase
MSKFKSTKLYDGYSTVFRQWKADGTHCRFLHAYYISFKLGFDQDVNIIFKQYPEFKKYLNAWFKSTFDYKTFLAEDDPYLEHFKQMDEDGIIQLTILKNVGCERFSEFTYNEVNRIISNFGIDLNVISVETFEHDKNSAIFMK